MASSASSNPSGPSTDPVIPTTTTTTTTVAVKDPPMFKKRCDCWLWLIVGMVIGFAIAYFWFKKGKQQ